MAVEDKLKYIRFFLDCIPLNLKHPLHCLRAAHSLAYGFKNLQGSVVMINYP